MVGQGDYIGEFRLCLKNNLFIHSTTYEYAYKIALESGKSKIS